MMIAPPGPKLRDIHVPPPPGWWPPAIGWWLLATLLLAVLAVLVWRYQHHRRQRQRWRAAHAELEALAARQASAADIALYAAGVSQLLRRAARLHEPAAATASGPDWQAVLQRLAPDATLAQPLLQLEAVIYRPRPVLDVAATHQAAHAWLRHVLLRESRHA
jgi:hypothetical protein